MSTVSCRWASRGKDRKIFQSTFYPHCLSEWHKLDPEIRTAPSTTEFDSKLLSKIRFSAKSVFGIHDLKGLSYVAQLRGLRPVYMRRAGPFSEPAHLQVRSCLPGLFLQIMHKKMVWRELSL